MKEKGEIEARLEEVGRILAEIRAGRPASAPEAVDAVGRLAAALRGEGLPVDGRFTLKNAPEGILLAVFPASGGGRPVTEKEARRALEEAGYAYDPGLVAEAVARASGEPVVVGAPRRDYRKDAKIRIEFDAEKVRAYLVLVAPEPGGLPPSWNDVEAAVRAAGLKEWARAAARAAVEDERYGEEVLLATGRPPVHGRDGAVEPLFDPDPHLAPPVDERDRADFRVVRRIANVRAGEPVARVHPPVRGTPGVTATGVPIPARHGAPAPVRLGRNVRLAEDGLTVVATEDGQAVLDREGRLSVEPLFVVEGDLDMATGNIDFLGTILVRGRIQDGFRVRASRDVHAAAIGRAEVEAGGSVVVEGGIVGAPRVTVGGDVVAKFVEGATVRAGRHVVVREAILHSRVAAGRTVLVFGGKGAAIGGRVVAGEEVWCRAIGAAVGTPTSVEVGVEASLLDRLKAVEEAAARDGALLADARRAIEILKAGPASPDRRKRLLALEGAVAALAPRVAALEEEAGRLQTVVRGTRGGRVSARDEVFAKVRVAIGGAATTTAVANPYVTFRRREEEIVAVPLEGPPLDRDLAKVVEAFDDRRPRRGGRV